MNKFDAIDVIDYTESLCPFCLKRIEARIVVNQGAVYMKKICPDHGPMSVSLWPDLDHYQWIRSFRMPFKPPLTKLQIVKGCPFDCGLCSAHLRHPTLVEIEVTHQCNLRCPVCFMSAGDAPADPTMQSLENMYAAILEQSGNQTSIQITGGEPTVCENLAEIVNMGQQIGFSAIEINTNGLALSRHEAYAGRLAQAGVSGIYLQFDGLTSDVYQKLRGQDLLADKLKAIQHCRSAGIQVVLAMTIIYDINHNQLGDVLRFALENTDVVAGLALQPAFTSGRFDMQACRRLSMGDVVFFLAEQSQGLLSPYDFWPLGCSHPLCSSATYLLKDEYGVRPVTQDISPLDYIAQFNPESPQGSIFPDILAAESGRQPTGLSIVIMNYMDSMTVDLKRLKECSMLVAMEDGRLIPFCAYQVTSLSGGRIYKPWGREVFENNRSKTNAFSS